jgi:hypothetical protein
MRGSYQDIGTKIMNDEDHKKAAAALACGLLSPVFDWSPEQRVAALEEAEPDNVIWLEQYRLH